MMKQSSCVLVSREFARGHVAPGTAEAAGLFPNCPHLYPRHCPLLSLFSPAGRHCSGCFHGDMYRMVLPVRRRIHWGIGLFCFWALASFCLTRKVLWLCFRDAHRQHNLSLSSFWTGEVIDPSPVPQSIAPKPSFWKFRIAAISGIAERPKIRQQSNSERSLLSIRRGVTYRHFDGVVELPVDLAGVDEVG